MRIVMVSDLLPVDSLLNSVCKLSLIIIIKDTAKKSFFFLSYLVASIVEMEEIINDAWH